MRVVIYTRFSSHKQTEASTLGQLEVCRAYIRQKGYTEVGVYSDEATTGKNDNRPMFKQMLEDSKKKQFDIILVYQLDRFSRSRYDSAHNKHFLKKNGVKVVSAKEPISDDASGILMETVLEGMAEYYSAELSQKIKRGMDLKAKEFKFTGGGVPLGYRLNESKRFELNEDTAPTVVKIFEMYANGKTVAQINEYMNSRFIKTVLGKPFNKNSLTALLRNRRYMGIYIYNGEETPDKLPRIVSDELFLRVQLKLAENKKAPAKGRAKAEYILTPKLHCGHCKTNMVGISGTGRHGNKYNYYVCNKARRKECDKKSVTKQWAEDLVICKCKEILTDENIDKIANEVVSAHKREQDKGDYARLQTLLKDNERKRNNLMRAVAECDSEAVRRDFYSQLNTLSQERIEIEQQLAIQLRGRVLLTKEQIIQFLRELQKGNVEDLRKRKAFITVFVNEIYLYDRLITFILNAGAHKVEITEQLVHDIEQSNGVSNITNCGLPITNMIIYTLNPNTKKGGT